MTAALSAILAMIEQFLPLLTSTAQTATIDAIINALTQMLPFIINEIASLYQPVKNIIAALSANPATLATQAATLQTLDTQVDAAFDAAASDTDAGQ